MEDSHLAQEYAGAGLSLISSERPSRGEPFPDLSTVGVTPESMSLSL